MELERDVVEPRLASLDELEGVRLVVAGEVCAPALSPALDEPQLDTPARGRLVEVPDPQRDVVDAPEADQGDVPSRAMRSASSSGIASAT
jgi:hypothetical protein